MAMRKTGSRSLVATASLLAAPVMMLASCGPTTPEPIANIPVPLPANIPLVEVPPPPPVLINQSKGEDLWHLRSGLNVAVLLCLGPDNQAMVTSYNHVLSAHKGLLAAAAQTEVDHFRTSGNKKWQDAYDDHMTRIYNAYSGTLTRQAFCSRSRSILTEAETATADALNDSATVMLWELNKAAGLPDPDGKRAHAAAAPPSGAPAASLAVAAPASGSGTR